MGRRRKKAGKEERKWVVGEREADFDETPRSHLQLWKTQPLLLPA